MLVSLCIPRRQPLFAPRPLPQPLRRLDVVVMAPGSVPAAAVTAVSPYSQPNELRYGRIEPAQLSDQLLAILLPNPSLVEQSPCITDDIISTFKSRFKDYEVAKPSTCNGLDRCDILRETFAKVSKSRDIRLSSSNGNSSNSSSEHQNTPHSTHTTVLRPLHSR
eukprot:COSAG01_NODE_3986_length_5464_cov_13.193780_5_plen_164_part_00